MSGYVLAIDQGTTSSRAILFDRDYRIAAVDQQEFEQHFPKSGWVEHEPEDIWDTTLATCRGAMAKAGAEAKDIAAIGITNQRETTVVWDRETGKAIHRAIVWQDRRTAEICAGLKRAGEEERVSAKPVCCWTPIFGYEARLDSRQCRWRARGRGGRAAGLRHRGQLPAVASDRWKCACHRRHQRQPHDALRYPRRALERGAS